MLFESRKHKELFEECVRKTKSEKDMYRLSTLYALTCCEVIRQHFDDVYDLEENTFNQQCFEHAWHTGTTIEILRFALNMFNDFRGFDKNDMRYYTPYQLFGNCYCRYLLEAVKLRYPEYNTEE